MYKLVTNLKASEVNIPAVLYTKIHFHKLTILKLLKTNENKTET